MAESVSVYIRDDDLVAALDRHVDSGEYRNRSHAVEEALSELFDAD